MGMRRSVLPAMVVSVTACLVGCGHDIRLSEVARPTQLRCLDVPRGLETQYTAAEPPLSFTRRFAAGPYIADGEFADGTFYRAPYGNIYNGRTDQLDQPPRGFPTTIYEGGFWLPNKPGSAPYFYLLFRPDKSTLTAAPAGARCADAIAVKNRLNPNQLEVIFRPGKSIATYVTIPRDGVMTPQRKWSADANLTSKLEALIGKEIIIPTEP